MFKLFRIAFKAFPRIVIAYFSWMLRYSRHKEKYSIEERYNKLRELALKVLHDLKVKIYVSNLNYYQQEKISLIVPNHLSLLDPVILIALSKTPLAFVAKKETQKQPFIGRAMKIIDCEFINRDNVKSQLNALKKVKVSLANHERSWGIFPEGRRNKNRQEHLLQEYHAGTFKMATSSKVPLIPVVLEGSYRALSLKYHTRRYPVSVKFLPKVDIEGKSTTQIAQEVHDISLKTLQNLIPENLKLLK